jgi:hypothetical protein
VNKSLSTLACVSRQVYEPARAWGGLGRVCPAVTPDAVRSTNAKGDLKRRMTVKQKRDKELGYSMWVLGPGPMMMRLFLPDVRTNRSRSGRWAGGSIQGYTGEQEQDPRAFGRRCR